MLATHGVRRLERGQPRVAPGNLRFVAGELTAVIGPNGSGKSSLLSLLCGDLAPSQGRVSLDGVDLRHWRQHALARRRTVLPQQLPGPLPYTVAEVVALGRAGLAPECPRALDEAVAAALAQVGLAGQAQTAYDRLSGGQQARVQMARCLAQLQPGHPAPILLLDEPTASLDPRWQHACLQQARALATQGWCVICVLHDLNLAATYAQRIILLHRGTVLLDDAAEAVIRDPRLDQAYELEFRRLQLDPSTWLIVPQAGVGPSSVRRPAP